MAKLFNNLLFLVFWGGGPWLWVVAMAGSKSESGNNAGTFAVVIGFFIAYAVGLWFLRRFAPQSFFDFFDRMDEQNAVFVIFVLLFLASLLTWETEWALYTRCIGFIGVLYFWLHFFVMAAEVAFLKKHGFRDRAYLFLSIQFSLLSLVGAGLILIQILR